MEKLISIIIPVHNAENTLDRCLKSIIEGTYNNLEILLMENGSTDSSAEICQTWVNKDKRIKYYSLPFTGVSAARNAGLEKITGDYFTFVDADDWVEAEIYSHMAESIEKYSADRVVCKVNIGEESGGGVALFR